MEQEAHEAILDAIEADTDKIMKTINLMQHLRELRARQAVLMDELEYALLIRYVWERHGGYSIKEENKDGKLHMVAKFKYRGSHTTKGYLVIERKDASGFDVEYPVRVNFGRGYQRGTYNTPMDMWDETGEIPDRFFQMFLKMHNDKKHHGDLTRAYNLRKRKEAEVAERRREREEDTHGGVAS